MNITGDFEKAAKSLLRTGKEHVRVEMTRKMDSGRLAVRTIRNLPGTLDTDETDILFFHDMSGAPTVEIAENIPCRTTSGREALNGNTSKRIFISLSDEADIRVCLAVSSKEDSSLLGVGIDLADVRDAEGTSARRNGNISRGRMRIGKCSTRRACSLSERRLSNP